jgi:arylsulfatase A-like enzyme
MKPNILFFTADQQRYDHVGINGLRGVATPALDRIGTEGVSFTRAYCPSPLCTPTRLSLLTGLYPSVHRGHTLGVTVDPFPKPTIAERLQQAGYATALIGKSHFTERRLEEAHLLEHIGNYKGTSDWPFDGPYIGFDDVQIASGHNLNTVPEMHYKRFLERTGFDYAQWFPKIATGSYDGEAAGVWNVPESCHNTAWVGAETVRWLERKLQHPEQPWFCWVNFEDPHEPMRCPEPWFSKVDTKLIELFEPNRPGEFADKPPFYQEAALGDWSRFDDPHLTPCVYPRRRLDTNAKVALQATLGMVAFIDDRVGRVINLLETNGQLENTVIIYASDHGELHGHHGFWGKGLTAYEDCQRVPLLVWAPGQSWRKGHSDAIINLIDLPRLFLSLAGLETPQGLQGVDFLPYLEARTDAPRRGTVIEAHVTSKIYQQTYVNQRYKLVIYREEDWGELYDLENDPHQYLNLWNKDKTLQLHLLHEMKQQRMYDEGYAHPRRSFG